MYAFGTSFMRQGIRLVHFLCDRVQGVEIFPHTTVISLVNYSPPPPRSTTAAQIRKSFVAGEDHVSRIAGRSFLEIIDRGQAFYRAQCTKRNICFSHLGRVFCQILCATRCVNHGKTTCT